MYFKGSPTSPIGGIQTNFKKDGNGHNYNFQENEDFELTMVIAKKGWLTFGLKSGGTSLTRNKLLLIFLTEKPKSHVNRVVNHDCVSKNILQYWS